MPCHQWGELNFQCRDTLNAVGIYLNYATLRSVRLGTCVPFMINLSQIHIYSMSQKGCKVLLFNNY